MMREEFADLMNKTTRQELRKFGLTTGLFFAAIAAYLFWKQSAAALYPAIPAGLLLLFALVWPGALRPVFRVWMGSALAIGFVMTRVILTVIFTLMFVPVGLVLRLLGKDPLDRKPDAQAESYWIRRVEGSYQAQSTENQF